MHAAIATIRRNRLGCGCGALLLFAIGFVWWLQRPSYLELPIEVKVPPHRDSFWRETHFTQVRYDDTWGALYVYRQTGDAHADIQGWKTAAEIMAFFDGWLRRHGWRYLEKHSPGDAILPEACFLQDGTHYRLYARGNDPPWEGPWVAVAIDPVYEGAFDVTLITVQPSWLRRLDKSFD